MKKDSDRDAAALVNSGLTMIKMKEADRAIDDFSKAIKLNPELASAYYYRGHVKYAMAKYRDAIEDYNKAIEKKSDSDS